MLHDMERSAGLSDLSPIERDVLYAVSELDAGSGEVVRSETIHAHDLVRGVPVATFHRAVRELVQRNFLQMAPGRKRGAYVLTTRG